MVDQASGRECDRMREMPGSRFKIARVGVAACVFVYCFGTFCASSCASLIALICFRFWQPLEHEYVGTSINKQHNACFHCKVHWNDYQNATFATRVLSLVFFFRSRSPSHILVIHGYRPFAGSFGVSLALSKIRCNICQKFRMHHICRNRHKHSVKYATVQMAPKIQMKTLYKLKKSVSWFMAVNLNNVPHSNWKFYSKHQPDVQREWEREQEREWERASVCNWTMFAVCSYNVFGKHTSYNLASNSRQSQSHNITFFGDINCERATHRVRLLHIIRI